jgi:hypothetical protein
MPAGPERWLQHPRRCSTAPTPIGVASEVVCPRAPVCFCWQLLVLSTSIFVPTASARFAPTAQAAPARGPDFWSSLDDRTRDVVSTHKSGSSLRRVCSTSAGTIDFCADGEASDWLLLSADNDGPKGSKARHWNWLLPLDVYDDSHHYRLPAWHVVTRFPRPWFRLIKLEAAASFARQTLTSDI